VRTPIEQVVSEIEAIRRRVEQRTATTRMRSVTLPPTDAPPPTTTEPVTTEPQKTEKNGAAS